MVRSLTLFSLFLGVSALAPAALLTQCPAVGLDTGCGILITITGASGGAATSFTVIAASAPTQPPYDGSEDTLVGVLNSSGATVNSIVLSSSTDIFGFDNDGPCTVSPNPGNCNAAEPSGYAGPNVTFSGINGAFNTGTVNFTGGLPDGQSRWFGLEEALTPSQIVPGIPEPSTVFLTLTGISAILGFKIRRRGTKA
jgi:hypothetical protein